MELKSKMFEFSKVFSQIFEFWANFLTRPFKTWMLLFLSLTYIYQNVPDSVKFCHLSLAPMMLFGHSNKLLLYVFHYQTPCMLNFVLLIILITQKDKWILTTSLMELEAQSPLVEFSIWSLKNLEMWLIGIYSRYNVRRVCKVS